jgi:hypothetical protein
MGHKRMATSGRLVSQALSRQVPGEGLRTAEDRGFEPRRVVTPNRISSADRGRPDQFKLDQRPWPVSLEPSGMTSKCNPNCKLVLRRSCKSVCPW